MEQITLKNYSVYQTKKLQDYLKDARLAQAYNWWLIESATGYTQSDMLAYQETILYEKELFILEQWLDQIINQHMPLGYVLGSVPFLDLTITVRPPILIPRPETEEWVSGLIAQLAPYKNYDLKILDLCTGSGCIALALAKAFPQAHIIASDISLEALTLAQDNARNNSINNVTFIQSDLYNALGNEKFDLIVSNPPYIAYHEWERLDHSVKNWEDCNALIAEDDGFKLIKKIITLAPAYLKRPITTSFSNVIIEIGYQQGANTAMFMTNAGYNHVKVQKDYANHDRIVKGTMHGDIQNI